MYSDEGVMLKHKLHCPIAIAADRTRGVELLRQSGCDVVVADDGLQHYAMARDVEIALVDATRGLGNGLLLPAGPLRELWSGCVKWTLWSATAEHPACTRVNTR